MKCSKCSAEMVIREGKFGKFWACPKSHKDDNHGTVKFATQKSYVARDHGPSWGPDSLFTRIKRQSVAFGAPMDDMQNLCEWIVDNPADCYDDLGEETDHWMNTRPY